MKILLQEINDLINKEFININKKIRGTSYLEILKFKLLEHISKIPDLISFETVEDSINENIFENDQKKLICRLISSVSPVIKLNLKLKNNLILISIKESIKIDVEDIQSKNFNSINLIPFTGVTLSEDTICNLNFKKKSIILEIMLEDKISDIEKIKENTI